MYRGKRPWTICAGLGGVALVVIGLAATQCYDYAMEHWRIRKINAKLVIAAEARTEVNLQDELVWIEEMGPKGIVAVLRAIEDVPVYLEDFSETGFSFGLGQTRGVVRTVHPLEVDEP